MMFLSTYLTGVKYPAKAPTAIRIQTECDPDDPEDSRFILYQYLGDETCTQPPIPGDSMVTVEKWPPFGAYVRYYAGVLCIHAHMHAHKHINTHVCTHTHAHRHTTCNYISNVPRERGVRAD